MSRRGFVIILATFLALGLFPQAPTGVVIALFAISMFIGPAANNIEFVYPPRDLRHAQAQAPDLTARHVT